MSRIFLSFYLKVNVNAWNILYLRLDLHVKWESMSKTDQNFMYNPHTASKYQILKILSILNGVILCFYVCRLQHNIF
jgi:hypothetical protein